MDCAREDTFILFVTTKGPRTGTCARPLPHTAAWNSRSWGFRRALPRQAPQAPRQDAGTGTWRCSPCCHVVVAHDTAQTAHERSRCGRRESRTSHPASSNDTASPGKDGCIRRPGCLCASCSEIQQRHTATKKLKHRGREEVRETEMVKHSCNHQRASSQ